MSSPLWGSQQPQIIPSPCFPPNVTRETRRARSMDFLETPHRFRATVRSVSWDLLLVVVVLQARHLQHGRLDAKLVSWLPKRLDGGRVEGMTGQSCLADELEPDLQSNVYHQELADALALGVTGDRTFAVRGVKTQTPFQLWKACVQNKPGKAACSSGTSRDAAVHPRWPPPSIASERY